MSIDDPNLFWDSLRRPGQCFVYWDKGTPICGHVAGEPSPGFFMVKISSWKDRSKVKCKLVSPARMEDWEFFPSVEERESFLKTQEALENVRKERRGANS